MYLFLYELNMLVLLHIKDLCVFVRVPEASTIVLYC